MSNSSAAAQPSGEEEVLLRHWVTAADGSTVRRSHVTRVARGAGQLDEAWAALVGDAPLGSTVDVSSTSADSLVLLKEGDGKEGTFRHHVEVLAVPEGAPPLCESGIPLDEWLAHVTGMKEDASHYIKTDPDTAAEGYAQCISVLDRLQAERGGEATGVLALLLSCRLNAALASLSLKRYGDALAYADAALAQDADNEKASYRRALAQRGLGDLAGAEGTLRHASSLYPKNSAVAKELKDVQGMRAAEARREKAVYGRMFQS